MYYVKLLTQPITGIIEDSSYYDLVAHLVKNNTALIKVKTNNISYYMRENMT